MACSASQIDKGRDCLRKWAFAWQIPFDQRVQNEAAAVGEQVHEVARQYHELGIKPDRTTEAGSIFLPALPYLPPPFVGRAEGKFNMVLSGISYTGFIDLSCTVQDLPFGVLDLPPRPDCDPGTPAVLDYKTVKSLEARRMLDGPGEFLDDVQVLLYLIKRLVETGAPYVYARWVYMKREGKTRAATARDALLSKAQILDAFGRIVHPIADQLVQLKKKDRAGELDPLTLPPTPATCYKYGRNYPCPFIEKCNLSLSEQFSGLMEDDMSMDMLAELKAKIASGAVPAALVQALAPVQEPAKGVNPPEAKAAPAPAPAPAQVSAPALGGGHVARLTSDEVDFLKALYKVFRG